MKKLINPLFVIGISTVVFSQATPQPPSAQVCGHFIRPEFSFKGVIPGKTTLDEYKKALMQTDAWAKEMAAERNAPPEYKRKGEPSPCSTAPFTDYPSSDVRQCSILKWIGGNGVPDLLIKAYFVDGVMVSVSEPVNTIEVADYVRAFTQKYGEPTVSQKTLHNKVGGTFESNEYLWNSIGPVEYQQCHVDMSTGSKNSISETADTVGYGLIEVTDGVLLDKMVKAKKMPTI